MDFQELINWLSANGFDLLATLLSVIFGLVIMIVQIKKYKFNSNQAKEYILKYRTEDYLTKKDAVPVSQTFKRIVPVYDLNDKDNTLVVVGTKDLQALIDSAKDCALDIVLEKYGVLPPSMLPAVQSKTDEPYDATDIRDDFEILSDYHNEVEAMRVRYKMPDASPAEILKFVSSEKSKLDKSIQDTLLKQKEIKKDEV